MNGSLHEELKNLLSEQQGPCLSLFMPTLRTGTESQQNQIRLKNLLRSAEEQLLTSGMRPQEVKDFLEPALALTGNILFWRRQSDGLALFRSPGLFRTFTLPEVFDAQLTVSHRFHVRPLLSLFQKDRRFYILALSQKKIHLLEGTGEAVREIELASLPESLVEALQVDEVEKQVRFRTGAVGGGGTSMVSGHGAVQEDTKDNLVKYFRLIDRGLRDFLREEKSPLILSGVDYLFPIYREVNTYPHLVEEGIPGNPKSLTPEAILRAAQKIVHPLFAKAEQEAIAQYHQSSGTGLASAEVGEIVPAASHGRVGVLFVAADAREWGRYQRDTDQVEQRAPKGEKDEDLIEIAALQTYLNGGAVFILPPGRMPEPQPLVAVFRY